MRIPAYWSRATAEDLDRNRRKVAFSCWRSSDHSPKDAHESALAAAKRVLQLMLADKRRERYGYGSVPLREEVIERFADAEGMISAAVTRNASGAMVLNAAGAMFIDLDFPPISAGEGLLSFFARFFNKSANSPDAQRQATIESRLENFIRSHPDWGFRVYRTCAGVRALATHDLFDPTAVSTLDVLCSLGADPLYVRLCKGQQCFRARLTPKPWRCGCRDNTVSWPQETEDQQSRFQQWLTTYKSRHVSYATCRFLGAIGRSAVHPELKTLIEVHDKVTQCNEPLPLA